jgi:hypothetical protein
MLTASESMILSRIEALLREVRDLLKEQADRIRGVK